MKKELFHQHQKAISDQLKSYAKAIEDITYEDFLIASEQAIKDGHEDPECTAMYGLIIPHISINIDQILLP